MGQHAGHFSNCFHLFLETDTPSDSPWCSSHLEMKWMKIKKWIFYCPHHSFFFPSICLSPSLFTYHTHSPQSFLYTTLPFLLDFSSPFIPLQGFIYEPYNSLNTVLFSLSFFFYMYSLSRIVIRVYFSLKLHTQLAFCCTIPDCFCIDLHYMLISVCYDYCITLW